MYGNILVELLLNTLKTEDFIERKKYDEVKKYKDMIKYNCWIQKYSDNTD